MNMDRQKIEHLRRHPEVSELLYGTLPRMQPSAIKHSLLTSVANVMNNPIASRYDYDYGSTSVIGFADLERTIPLVIAVEDQPDGSIRHALTPNRNSDIDKALFIELQENENEFCAMHGIKNPREIYRQFRTQDRSRMKTRGLDAYSSDDVNFDDDEYWGAYKQNFYPTEHLPDDYEIDIEGKPDLENPDINQRLRSNIAYSAQLVDENAKIQNISFTTASKDRATSKDTMHLRDIVASSKTLSGQNEQPRTKPFVRKVVKTPAMVRQEHVQPDPQSTSRLEQTLAKYDVDPTPSATNPSKNESTPAD